MGTTIKRVLITPTCRANRGDVWPKGCTEPVAFYNTVWTGRRVGTCEKHTPKNAEYRKDAP